MKIVKVEWWDSNYLHGWQTGEIPCALALCQSIGFLREEDSDKIVLSQTESEFGAHMGILAIAKGCIKSIKEMRMK